MVVIPKMPLGVIAKWSVGVIPKRPVRWPNNTKETG